MKLEMATFPVKEAKFGNKMGYSNGVLEINKAELLALIKEDKRVESVDIDIAFPGDKTRIVNVRDVVEPRIKVSGPGCVFPGILGPVETVGEGKTHRLSGVTIIPSATYRPTIRSGTDAENSAILDMWGIAAEVVPFGSTINVVPIFKLIDGVTELEACDSILKTELKVAQRLAEVTRDLTPHNVEVFELSEVDPSLPKIVYIVTVMTKWHQAHSGIAYYGLPIRESLPTFVHPNEFLDGAFTKDARKGFAAFTDAWTWLNHPIVFGLFREHGKRLNFLGVILQRTRFETGFGKQVSAAATSQMARLLGADGALVTRITGSGANFIDVMLTVQACERKGVKTVFITPEWGGRDGTELPLVFYVPEATAMVSTGSTDRAIKLPGSPAKVIGCKEGEFIQLDPQGALFSPWDELTVEEHDILGGDDWWGLGHYTRKAY